LELSAEGFPVGVLQKPRTQMPVHFNSAPYYVFGNLI
jgi:hypothetical protein